MGVPKGGAPNPEKVRAPKGGRPEGWGPEKVKGPRFAFFSVSRHNFHSFFSLLGVLSLNFGGVFLKRRGGLSCETPAASGPPGFHTTTRELLLWFQGPGASKKHHQNSTRRHPERDRKRT